MESSLQGFVQDKCGRIEGTDSNSAGIGMVVHDQEGEVIAAASQRLEGNNLEEVINGIQEGKENFSVLGLIYVGIYIWAV